MNWVVSDNTLYGWRLAAKADKADKADKDFTRQPQCSEQELEMATLQWVDWFNQRKLLGPIGYIPPAEAEMRYSETCLVQYTLDENFIKKSLYFIELKF